MAPPPHSAGLDPSSALLPTTGGLCRQERSPEVPFGLSTSDTALANLSWGAQPQPRCSDCSPAHIPVGFQTWSRALCLLLAVKPFTTTKLCLLWLFQPLIRLSPLQRGLRASHARPCTSGFYREELHTREEKEPWGWLWRVDVQQHPASLWPLGWEHSKTRYLL